MVCLTAAPVWWRKVFAFIGAAWLCPCVVSAAPPRAQPSERPRVVHVLPGFGFQTRAGCWNPMQVQIENAGAETQVVVVAQSPAGEYADAVSIRRDIAVPARARVHLFLPVFPTRDPPESRGAIEFAETWLSDGAAARWGGLSVMGTLARHETPLILVCDAANRSFDSLKKGLAASRDGDVVRAVIAPAEFPAHPAALAPVDVLILGGLGDYAFTAFQTDALRRWIEAGGVLVLVPDADFNPAQLGALEPLLPVQFGPPSRIHHIEIPAKEGRASVQSTDGFLFRPLTLREGRAIWGPAEAPLAAVRTLGAGRIVAFAVDLGDAAFDDWSGVGFWNSPWIAVPSPARRVAARQLAAPAVLPQIVGDLVGISAPSRWVAAAYLGAVLTLILAPLLLGHLLRRPVGGWVVSATSAVLIGFLAVRAGRDSAGDAAAQFVEIYLRRAGLASTAGVAQSLVALYAPQGGVFALRGGDEAVLFDPLRETPPSAVDLRWTDRLEMPALAVRPRAVRVTAVTGSVSLAPPYLTLRLDGKGLHAQVSNPGPMPLRDAFLRIRRLVVPLGDVPPGSEHPLPAIRPATPRSEMVYVAQALRGTRTLTQERLFGALYPSFSMRFDLPAPALATVSDEPWLSPVFGYWTNQPSGLIGRIEPETASRALGLTLIETALTYEGDRLCWPRGTLPVHLPDRPTGVRSHPDGFYMGWQPAEFTLQFTLPEDAPSLITERLRVFRLFESDAHDCAVALESPGGSAAVELPEGVVVEAPAPSSQTASPARAVRLRVRIRPRASAAGGAPLQPWLIRDLDIEWVGRVVPPSVGERHD